MAEAFTVFEKFGDVCAALDVEDRKELIYAINMYGMFGEEVELPYGLKPIFIALKEDIDYSKDSRKRGAKGGRPKSKPPVCEPCEPEVSETEKPEVLENAEPEVCWKPRETESQYKAIQSNTEQSKTKGKRFVPPTVEEVRELCERRGYAFDPEAFVDFYESKGWMVGRNPMKSWPAACATWQKREEPSRARKEEDDEYARL